MKIAIIVSENDMAGMNIKDFLVDSFDEIDERFDGNNVYSFKGAKLYTLKTDTIFTENLDKKIDADIFIFATRHRSSAGKRSLCVHTPGNWSKAEHGGKEGKLCFSPADHLREAYLELKKSDLDVTLEVTHHGPYMEKPVMFIEIGSSEKEWCDKDAGKIIAKVIIDLVGKKIKKHKKAVGIGGIHYAAVFNKILERTELAIGHICPKYQLESLDEGMLKQALEKSDSKLVILDWKGLGKDKSRIKEMIEKMGIEFVRSDRLN